MCSFQDAHDVSISALTALTLRFLKKWSPHHQAVLKPSHDHRAVKQVLFELQARANIAVLWPIVVTRLGGFGEFCNFYVDTLFWVRKY
jgi:hypothetical protein